MKTRHELSAIFDDLRHRLARLKLAERGTDNGWIDDEAVAHCRREALKAAIKLVQKYDQSPSAASPAIRPQEQA